MLKKNRDAQKKVDQLSYTLKPKETVFNNLSKIQKQPDQLHYTLKTKATAFHNLSKTLSVQAKDLNKLARFQELGSNDGFKSLIEAYDKTHL